ncbi:MAG TPA: UDP-3-O-(3-hydroxymyristoyl)glucosamine N-acyltransferase [Burkholderiaceae bacterium]|nr:UDP-3-O-(3-hydroxymyristoyl)glucosamine N-acyltransferase [Burkholderiaceae bacterium]HQR71001.1 UDP-3-O-(3-hydroxymyristoyl)glucosamine N-acyltransferase [Burkholderiaceae bacterium]
MLSGGLSLSDLTAAIIDSTQGRLRATLLGSPDRCVTSVAPIATAAASDLAFLANPRFRRDAQQSKAGAIVLTAGDADAIGARADVTLVVVDAPYAWFALAAQRLHPEPPATAGVDPAARIGRGVRIDDTASVGAGAFVGDDAAVGTGAVISAGAHLGARAVLGAGSRLHPRAVVLDDCTLGERCIVHSGAVIGADGFGFAPLDGKWIKIPQLGRVIIGDDVDIGANTTIDRGTMGDTVIESGVKLDNQIQIGHNCFVGANTVMAGCVGVAGSARIGRNCMIGGSAGIAGHLSIADGCVIGPATVVSGSITTAGHYTGFFPIMKNREWERAAAVVRQLDDLRRRVRELEAAGRGEKK